MKQSAHMKKKLVYKLYFCIVTEIAPGFLLEPEDVHCIVTDDVEFRCAKTKQRYSITWFINEEPVDEAMIKSKNERLKLSVGEDGLEHIFSLNNVELNDNCEIYAKCESDIKSRVAYLKSVPIIFEESIKDTKIFASETAKFETTTNKADVEVSTSIKLGLFPLQHS